MKIRRHSKHYNFIGDKVSGETFRWGASFSENPIIAPWPELADISISNHCTKGCNYCYKNSRPNQSFMTIEDYELILKSLIHPHWGSVFQVAIGGGEPLEHPDFENIINKTLEYGVIPNLTTNGERITKDIAAFLKNRVGALALSVSIPEDIIYQTHRILIDQGVRTNIHYILSQQSIEGAIGILEGRYNKILSGVNGIIFLTYKATGRATRDNYLEWNDTLRHFISLIDDHECSVRIGFDACFVPLLLHLTKTNPDFIDNCECGFFSVYIDEKLVVKPCSFCSDDKYGFNLKNISFDEIWHERFKAYRVEAVSNCQRKCRNVNYCQRQCILFDEINICYSETEEGHLCL
jgi:MoaA/NifB/PqqE/SkfB family radical SAM enzyme